MTSTSSTAARLGLAAWLGFAAASIGACGLVVNGEELGAEAGVEDDILEYAQLGAALDDERDQALGADVVVLRTGGPWLAWIDGDSLGLRRYPDEYELQLPAPELDYRVSPSLVVTRALDPGGVRYRGFALPEGELVEDRTLVGTTALFTVLDDVVLGVADGELWRWELGSDPVVLGTLVDAGSTAVEVTRIEALADASGERVVLVAETQLWLVELAPFTAVALGDLDELLAVDLRGALVVRDGGLVLVEFDGQELAIDEAITATGWSLNATFATIHEYSGDGATLAGDRVVYIGRAGVFAYDLDGSGPNAITPVLLEPRWDVGAGIARIEYRKPVTAGSTVLVRGLTGIHGEVGDSGPIYSTRLAP